MKFLRYFRISRFEIFVLYIRVILPNSYPERRASLNRQNKSIQDRLAPPKSYATVVTTRGETHNTSPNLLRNYRRTPKNNTSFHM